ncbi:hypothetical protein CDAR_396631 [Caerostris darwini]|uniref:Uncharacterized protein n=1 Tax=Caerostris darwini TaxID=1538125 RepID=A0AAV4PPV0_9ARAC|nr:hypothetical protein CDAR_396631 [Caerostris darwini]
MFAVLDIPHYDLNNGFYSCKFHYSNTHAKLQKLSSLQFNRSSAKNLTLMVEWSKQYTPTTKKRRECFGEKNFQKFNPPLWGTTPQLEKVPKNSHRVTVLPFKAHIHPLWYAAKYRVNAPGAISDAAAFIPTMFLLLFPAMPCIPSECGLAYRAASLNGAEKWVWRDLSGRGWAWVGCGEKKS